MSRQPNLHTAHSKPTLYSIMLQAKPSNTDSFVNIQLTSRCGINLTETNSANYAKALDSSNQSPTSPFQKRVEGTNTMRPIMFHKIPHDQLKDVAHVRVVCDVKLGKEDPNRTRITIGGNTIAYAGDCGTKTGSIEVVKGIFNSVCSRPGAKFLSADITNYYLGTPLDCPEYARIRIEDIPQEFIDEYNLMQYVHNGWVYFEITKGIYGLKQAGKLANDLLTERLSKHGYFQCATTPGLWRHKWRPVVFVLIVDDFGIENVEKEHAEHLLSALRADYTITTDWTGKRYAGIDIEWDYDKRRAEQPWLTTSRMFEPVSATPTQSSLNTLPTNTAKSSTEQKNNMHTTTSTLPLRWMQQASNGVKASLVHSYTTPEQ